MASYKVTYFDGRGNGEVIRVALSAAGQKFEDERLAPEDWAKLKPNTPMKALPTLTVTENGKTTVYGQSKACARYIANKYGLMGATPEENLLIDEVSEGVTDVAIEVYKCVFEKDEARKSEYEKKFGDEVLPKFAGYVEKRTKEYGKGGYIIGGKLTLADLSVFVMVDQIPNICNFGAELDKFPALKAHAELVKKDKGVAEWIGKRPNTKY